MINRIEEDYGSVPERPRKNAASKITTGVLIALMSLVGCSKNNTPQEDTNQPEAGQGPGSSQRIGQMEEQLGIAYDPNLSDEERLSRIDARVSDLNSHMGTLRRIPKEPWVTSSDDKTEYSAEKAPWQE